jgi:hypothetical protein
MIILMLFSAALVALALDRQQRRHRLEIEIECSRYGVDIPPQRARISRFEGYMNIGVGALLLFTGCAMGWLLLVARDISAAHGSLQVPALFAAAGVVMLLLGGRVLRRSRR